MPWLPVSEPIVTTLRVRSELSQRSKPDLLRLRASRRHESDGKPFGGSRSLCTRPVPDDPLRRAGILMSDLQVRSHRGATPSLQPDEIPTTGEYRP